MAEVVLYSKPGCHLCDSARNAILVLRDRMAFEFSECNILTQPVALARFPLTIPVVEVNGSVICETRLDEPALLRALLSIQQ